MESDYSYSQPPPANIAPADYIGEVWPPPPTSETFSFAMPFKTVFLRVEGSVPEFRTGGIQIGTQGITISGKCVPRYEIQVPILLVCLPLRVFLIAYLIMEYAVRRDEMLHVARENLRQIVVNSRKRLVCFVYDAPNYKGIVKTFSLTTRLDAPTFDSFMATSTHLALPQFSEGKLKAWTSPPVWIFCGALLTSLIVIAIVLAFGHYSK